jgi:hypothetical protein
MYLLAVYSEMYNKHSYRRSNSSLLSAIRNLNKATQGIRFQISLVPFSRYPEQNVVI